MGFRIPKAVLRGIPKPRIPDSTSKNFPLPESRLTYKRRIQSDKRGERGERKIGNASAAYPKSRLLKSVAFFVQSILLGIITVMIL